MSTPAPALIVTVEDVARRLGLPQPLDEDDRWLVEQAIVDAQADLEAYLGRAVTPATYTETGLVDFPDGWQLTHYPLISITTVTPEVDSSGAHTGLFTVEYVAGLDGAADAELEPLRRYVRTAAVYSPTVQAVFRRVLPDDARKVQSLSVEGQSITYADTYATSGETGTPGALPNLTSCDRWRVAGRRVSQRRRPFGVWPYDVDDCYRWARGWRDW